MLCFGITCFKFNSSDQQFGEVCFCCFLLNFMSHPFLLQVTCNFNLRITLLTSAGLHQTCHPGSRNVRRKESSPLVEGLARRRQGPISFGRQEAPRPLDRPRSCPPGLGRVRLRVSHPGVPHHEEKKICRTHT